MRASRFSLFAAALLAVIFAALPAEAGWGDIAKQAADEGSKAAGLSYTPSEAMAGVKEVLTLGSDYGVSTLTSGDGFSANAATALSLPDSLSGLSGSSSLLSALNSAAMDAVPETGGIFNQVIQGLSLADASSMFGSGSTSITDAFAASSRDTLKSMVKPVVEKSAAAAGVDTYLTPLNAAMQATGSTTTFDVTDYLSGKVVDGMLYYMGVKEESLRSTGGAGASALLQKLF
ncbi:DUF4197 family protein [Pseudodesulfovibrio cashew]|nr:DUF4197 family protein [Pseudodesulfovibrio cashew]